MKLPLTALFCAALLSPLAVETSRAAQEKLTQHDVELILGHALAKARRIDPQAIIAITDREGFLLTLWDAGSNQLPVTLPPFPGAFTPSFINPGSFSIGADLSNPPPPFSKAIVAGLIKQYSLAAGAVTRASTAAFLSSNQNAFTSRTAGFIIQQHFPPGIKNTGTGPLVGVGLSSLFFTDVQRVKLIPPGFDGATTVENLRDFGGPVYAPYVAAAPFVSPGVRTPFFPLTSLNDSPGGVPLYKNGVLVGGIGVTGDGTPTDLTPAGAIFLKQTQRNATTGFKTGRDIDEEVALAGQTGFRPPKSILATNVLINGLRIPYVFDREDQIKDEDQVSDFRVVGHPVNTPLPGATNVIASGMPQASPADYPYEVASFGGVPGLIRFPLRNDPELFNSKIGHSSRLTSEDVRNVINKVARRADSTRAGIRLPVGTAVKVFITVVANPNKPGFPAPILGVFQVGEATVFSWDVSAQKARTALFFSNSQLAFSSRTVGFLAQRFFPPGIDGRPSGPLFGFQEAVSLRQSPPPILGFPGDPNLPNGITIFPGGFPLYRDGQLIGAVGVSGDGVDQDDLISANGTANFLPPPSIRADTYGYRGARLPYVKFPRDPER